MGESFGTLITYCKEETIRPFGFKIYAFLLEQK